jgi:hypothetical protein
MMMAVMITAVMSYIVSLALCERMIEWIAE